MAIGYGEACPKPEKRKRLKARKKRAETTVKKNVRMLCVEREGFCALNSAAMRWRNGPKAFTGLKDVVLIPPNDVGACHGQSEWAHMHAKRRSKTLGLPPEKRHDTAHSLMLCHKHHEDYDAKRLVITALTRKGADGPLKFRRAK